MIHNRKARIAARRADAIERARHVLQEVANGSLDAYEGYRRVYGIYLGSSELAEELKPFFGSLASSRMGSFASMMNSAP